MIDNEFDNFVNGKLNDHAAPVPAGLWDKLADAQFDSFIGSKLKETAAPVPSGLWEKITDPAPFDGFISDKLNGYIAPVPAGLWEKIAPSEKDDRKGFFWFRSPAARISVFALLLAGILGGYLSITSEKKVLPLTGTAVQKNQQKTDGNEANTNVSSQTGKQPDATSTPAIRNSQPVDGQTNTHAVTNSANNTGNPEAGTSGQANPAGQPTSLENKNNISLGGKLHPAASNPFSSLETHSNNNSTSNREETNTPKENSNSMVHQATPADNRFEFIEPYQTNLLPAVTILTPAGRDYSLLNLPEKQLSAGNHTTQFRNVIICPTDRKSRNTDWQLEVYTSPDIAFKSVGNNTASQSYLLRKDSSESMRIGFTAGMRLVKPITDNILVKAGVQYSQLNQRYVYRTENEVKTTTVVSVRTIIRGPGDTVIVRDTSILQQIGYKNNMVINRFRSFDIPVTVGYQFGNEYLKIGINAGVIFNLSSWYQGVILDSSLATVPIVKGSPNMVYKSNLGLGLYGGISIIKRLSDDLHIFAEPYFRYNLSNMTTPQASYNQRFSLGGISVGLRVNLNRQ